MTTTTVFHDHKQPAREHGRSIRFNRPPATATGTHPVFQRSVPRRAKAYNEVYDDIVKAGESAFKACIPLYNSPYRDNPQKSLWLRGYKRAEREFFEQVKRSKAFQSTLEMEEVDE